MFGTNSVIQGQICEELSHGQAKFPRILSQNGQRYLEGQGQLPLFSIPAESIPGCMFGANLVMDGWMDGWMDGQTDAGNDNTPLAWKAKGLKTKESAGVNWATMNILDTTTESHFQEI